MRRSKAIYQFISQIVSVTPASAAMIWRHKQVIEAILGISNRRFLVVDSKLGLIIRCGVVIAILLNFVFDDVQRMICHQMKIASNF